jgi:ubiquinone/menaquinone biosynthesis C-methylase UbiE
MNTFKYGFEAPYPLAHSDLCSLFNNSRVYKYMIDRLIKLQHTDLPNYKVLEPGCGGGNKLRFFAEMRVEPENCYGLDVSEIAIELCKKLSPGAMNFQVGSALDMPYEDNTFDIVLCSGLFDCYNELTELHQLSSEVSRVLKPGGVLFICDINEHFNQMYGVNAYVMAKNLNSFDSTNQELEQLLGNHFDAIDTLPIFAKDLYHDKDTGEPCDVDKLADIEIKIDNGQYQCAYNLWTFVNQPAS